MPAHGTRPPSLTSRRFHAQVNADHQQALTLGAAGVPFTVIDGRYAMTGAQEIGTVVDALTAAWRAAARPLTVLGDQGGACDGDSCAVTTP